MATAVIIILVVLMLISLGSAMLFMLKDRGKTDRTINALTWRVGIWVVLLGFIIAGINFGWIKPSNSLQARAPAVESTQNQ